MKKNVSSAAFLCVFCTTIFFSCKKDDAVPAPTIVKQWTVALSAKNENPVPAGRTETGTALLMLMSDNSLTYTITVKDKPRKAGIDPLHKLIDRHSDDNSKGLLKK